MQVAKCKHVAFTKCMIVCSLHRVNNTQYHQMNSRRKVFFRTNKNTLQDKQTNERSPTKDRKQKNIERVCSLLRNSSFFTRKKPHKNSINIVEMFCGESNAISFLFSVLFVCAVHVAQSVGILSDVFFRSASKSKRYRRYIFLPSVTVIVSLCG